MMMLVGGWGGISDVENFYAIFVNFREKKTMYIFVEKL